MDVSLTTWTLTVVITLCVLCLDFVIVARNPHEPSLREATLWVCVYVGLAVLFGLGLTVVGGGTARRGVLRRLAHRVLTLGGQPVRLPADHGQVRRTPDVYQQKVLLIGIALSLVLRGIFIALGAEAIERFDWVFYIFGAFLIYTAWKLATSDDDEEEEFKENPVLRAVSRVLPTTDGYRGASLFSRVDAKLFVTPMLIVMVAIGTTDLIFALDSIPAIFGLTQEPYLVFTANAFALDGSAAAVLPDRRTAGPPGLPAYGLSIVLGFIGVKLVLEALHHYGAHWAPEIPILVSLSVIVVTLTATAALSLMKSARVSRQEALDAELDEELDLGLDAELDR